MQLKGNREDAAEAPVEGKKSSCDRSEGLRLPPGVYTENLGTSFFQGSVI